MRYALINNQNIIDNIISWDGETEWTPPENMTVINVDGVDCGIGWTYDGAVFTPPAKLELTQPT